MYPEALYGADVPGIPGPAGPYAEYAEVKQGDHAPRSLVAVTAVGPLSRIRSQGRIGQGIGYFFAIQSSKLIADKVNDIRKRNVPHMQGSKLYVGNLTYSVTEEQLMKLFSTYGDVKEVRVIERKGFGFVEMATPEDAEKAKAALNETVFEGRNLKIDMARPPQPRSDFRPRY